MKHNHFTLLVISGILFLSSATYAQDNNYITSKYDFIPGEKVIFFDDFTSENIGDFPAQWLTNGSGEIVTSEKFPGKWFHITKMGYFIPEAKEALTENFTIEFDFIPMTTDNSEVIRGFSIYLLTGNLNEPGGGGEPGDAGFLAYMSDVNISWKNWSMKNDQRLTGEVAFVFKANEKYHISIWVQKQRVRLYANENKVLDAPRAIPADSKPNIFRFESDQVSIPLVGNFRIAAGLPDMRNSLLKDGKIISYGIQFDINSDKLKPESYSTLKVISDILKEDPTLKLLVVGHTDSDGDDALNLDLSKRRAASVKSELVTRFTVDAAKLETEGKGESEPIAENNSAVNKAKNRRVEFINFKNKPATPTAVKQTAVMAPVNTTIKEAGNYKDIRNGKTYKTVKIDKQTWMAENLAYKTAEGCWSYENKESNLETYGYLYNWETAIKACPSGWHLPSQAEFEILLNSVGGDTIAANKLKETGTAHWIKPSTGATDELGFKALPGGARSKEGQFQLIGFYCFFWSSTENDSSRSWILTMYNSDVNKAILEMNQKANSFSVRCLKDN